MFRFLLGIVALMTFSCHVETPPSWPEPTQTSRPWTRWWWHGSAVTKPGITAELESMQRAGIGGVEITPIYGVKGREADFVEYLSPEWIDLLVHTLTEAKRLGLGVDMATGTGWPFGGPPVTEADASKNIHHQTYFLNEGERLASKIQYSQTPYIRGVRSNPDIASLKQPIAANKNLQQLAIDQVQFPRPLPLTAIVATGPNGEKLNLIDFVDRDGRLNWAAGPGKWRIDALWQGWHGKMVERAGPGGEGWVIDHFSQEALANYLARFDSAFQHRDMPALRAFFNDSYEVDDARGAADWTPRLLDEFKSRMGYDLGEHLPELFAEKANDTTRRILHDYRSVISELLLENFTKPWNDWANRNGSITRNQAHGSPSNILDLYATVGIPEIEGTEPLRIKMATSVANVMGKKLVSSESATWLNEHFQSSLGDIKSAIDLFWLNGVNHVFYHGTAYSAKDETWPGWLFYAAVHLNDRNPQWRDFHALNKYAERAQSILQNSVAAHDVLLYYPIADAWSSRSNKMIEHFDGIGSAFKGTSLEAAASTLLNDGFTFDYISDKQLSQVKLVNGKLRVPSGAGYKVIVVPDVHYIPRSTLSQLASLAQAGAPVVFLGGMPDSFAGYIDGQLDFNESLKQLYGKQLFIGSDLKLLLSEIGVHREAMVDRGIAFERRDAGRTIYLIKNTSAYRVTEIPFETKSTTVLRFDPMDGSITRLPFDELGHTTKIDVFLEPGEVVLISFEKEPFNSVPLYQAIDLMSRPMELNGPWDLSFELGGPSLPAAVRTNSLGSWTEHGAEYASFSGTAVYRTQFRLPDATTEWWIDLGDVRESAQVTLNGHDLGTVFTAPFRVRFEPSMAQTDNVLEVRVSNGMANRISDLDRRRELWKNFYNINFPSRLPENSIDGLFDASRWAPMPSGLLGPVRLVPLMDAPVRRPVPVSR